MKLSSLFVAIFCLLGQYIVAQSPIVIDSINSITYTSLTRVKDFSKMNVDEAKSIRRAILDSNNGNDKYELKLINKLIENKGMDIKVVPFEKNETVSSILIKGKLPASCVDILKTLVVNYNVEAFYNGNESNLKSLIDLASYSSYTKIYAIRFMASKMNEKWKKSSFTNSYKPLRDEIDMVFEKLKKLDDDNFDSGIKLLESSLTMLDQLSNDAIPNFIYSWLKTATKSTENPNK